MRGNDAIGQNCRRAFCVRRAPGGGVALTSTSILVDWLLCDSRSLHEVFHAQVFNLA